MPWLQCYPAAGVNLVRRAVSIALFLIVARLTAHLINKTGVPGNAGGFSLHAGVPVRANQRNERERLCRYISRPRPASSGNEADSAR